MKFKKSSLNNLDYNNIIDLNLDDIFKTDIIDDVKEDDIEIEKGHEIYNTKDDTHVKKIIIGEDNKKNSLKKFTKNKNKTYKFFD